MSTSAASLSSLAARAQLGDRTALETLLREISPGLLTHLKFLLHDPSDADDVLQETLWILVRRLGTLRDAPLVRAWSYRIATRQALRLIRRSQRHRTEDLTEADSIAIPISEAESSLLEANADVLRYLDQLPKKAQLVVRLRFIDGLSQQEVAEALEIPLGTVKSRLAYGLSQLRTRFNPQAAPGAVTPVR